MVLEEKIDNNKQQDEVFQNNVVDSFKELKESLNLIQDTQNNNCDHMGKRLEGFQQSVSNDMSLITKGLLSVQQNDLERNCIEYQAKKGMTAKEKRDFEKRWKMYKEMGGDDLEWVKEVVAAIPTVNY